MQSRKRWMGYAVVVLTLLLTGVCNAVNPKGKYPVSGQFRYEARNVGYTGNHAGKLTLKQTNLTGTLRENTNLTVQYALTLNKKVLGTGTSNRTFSGQFLRSAFGAQATLYTVTDSAASFKVNSKGAVVFNAALIGRGISGASVGSVYTCTMKGTKPAPAPA